MRILLFRILCISVLLWGVYGIQLVFVTKEPGYLFGIFSMVVGVYGLTYKFKDG